MFTKILFPTDFSDTADQSIEYIKQLQNVGAKKIIVINIIHQRIIDTLDTMHKAIYFQDGRFQEDAEKAERDLEEKRSEKLAGIVTELETVGYEVTAKVLKGYPVKEILRVEKEEAVSLIIMGSHGRSNFRRARIGSVSEKVIRRSVSPVLLIKR